MTAVNDSTLSAANNLHHTVNAELLTALADELNEGEGVLSHSMSILCNEYLPVECHLAAKQDYSEFTTRVANVASTLELSSLRSLMVFIEENVSSFLDIPPAQRPSHPSAMPLKGWTTQLSDFLSDPSNVKKAQLLIEFFQGSRWPWQANDGQLQPIIEDILLFAGSGESVTEQDEQKLATFTVEDLSLDIPDDISPKLLATFKSELPQNTASLSEVFQRIINGTVTVEGLNEARRTAHTLKGAANIVGIKGIANLTHYLEDILEFLANNKSLPSEPLLQTLSESSDCLEVMSEAILDQGASPPQGLTLLKSLVEWKLKIEKGDVGELKPIPEVEIKEKSEKKAAEKSSALPKTTAVTQDLLNKLHDLTGEISIENLLILGQFKEIFSNIDLLIRYQSVLRSQISTLQNLVFKNNFYKNTLPNNNADNNMGVFDPLEMDQYNELHSMGNAITELLDDLHDLSVDIKTRLTSTHEHVNHQGQMGKQLDQFITAERLLPVSNITARLQRNVRQTSRVTNKQVELKISGETLEVDSSILDNITDPLLHMLRNAVDHGIETTEVRAAQNKPVTAVINLEFYRRGNNITIICRDDGMGIDKEAITQKAIDLGLLKAGQTVSEKDLFSLILQPGFSTKNTVDQISGRGVGMDIVAKNIQELRGNLNIRSSKGQGTEIIINLPQTLMKVHIVLLEMQGCIFGVASSSFDQIIRLEREKVVNMEGKDHIAYNNVLYEVSYLDEVFAVNKTLQQSKSREITALLLHDKSVDKAIIIEQAIGEGELFIKKINKYIPKLNGIVGTVVTENGKAVPVFDVKEIFNKPNTIFNPIFTNDSALQIPDALNILVVDDSSSARRSLSQTIRDAGFDVRTAIDGVDAITLIEEKMPDLVLTDLEMPKMNGLELAAHLRANSDTEKLPIVMVTSRSTDKHREQASSTGINSYITKPFTNDSLMDELRLLLPH